MGAGGRQRRYSEEFKRDAVAPAARIMAAQNLSPVRGSGMPTTAELQSRHPFWRVAVSFTRSGDAGRRVDWSGEGSGLVCFGLVGELCRVTVGRQVTPTGLPVRELGSVLFPVYECRFVAEMVQERFGAEMRLSVYVGLHVGSIVPGGDAPPGVVCLGEGVGSQVALRFHCLFEDGGRVGEELIEQGRVPQPQAGDNDDGHGCPCPKPRRGPVWL